MDDIIRVVANATPGNWRHLAELPALSGGRGASWKPSGTRCACVIPPMAPAMRGGSGHQSGMPATAAQPLLSARLAGSNHNSCVLNRKRRRRRRSGAGLQQRNLTLRAANLTRQLCQLFRCAATCSMPASLEPTLPTVPGFAVRHAGICRRATNVIGNAWYRKPATQAGFFCDCHATEISRDISRPVRRRAG